MKPSPLFHLPRLRLSARQGGVVLLAAVLVGGAGWFAGQGGVSPVAPVTSSIVPVVPVLPVVPVAAAAVAVTPLQEGGAGNASNPAASSPTPASPAQTASALDAFAPLLDGRELAAFRELRIGALAGSGSGTGIAVINGKILHEGDMMGLARVACILPDALVLTFNNHNYVLRPRVENDEPATAGQGTTMGAGAGAAMGAAVTAAPPKTDAKAEKKRRKRPRS